MNDGLPDDLELLRALDVLLRERHVSRAAAKLGVTQSGASQRLARLRAHFGDELLVPGRPLMFLTPRAQAIAEPLARSLAALRSAVQAGAPFDPETSARRFTVLGSDLVEALAGPAFVDVLARTAPNVAWSFERTEADYAARLEHGTADLAFVPDFLAVPSLRRKPLPKNPFVVVARAGHPLTKPGSLTLGRYAEAGHVLVAPRGVPGSLVDEALARLGRSRRVVARVQHFMGAAFLVARSELIVTCPRILFTAAQPELRLVAMKSPAALRLADDRTSVVWHDRVHADPGHRWLREQLDGVLGSLSNP